MRTDSYQYDAVALRAGMATIYKWQPEPGGGVRGMGGYRAAKRALKDIFNLKTAAL